MNKSHGQNLTTAEEQNALKLSKLNRIHDS